MMIPSGEIQPQINDNCFIAPNRVIAGDIRVEADCLIWSGAVVSGDINSITAECRIDIENDALVHITLGRYLTAVSHFNYVKGYEL